MTRGSIVAQQQSGWSRMLVTSTCKDALNFGQSSHRLLCLSLPDLHHLIHPLLLQATQSGSHVPGGSCEQHTLSPLLPAIFMVRLELSCCSLAGAVHATMPVVKLPVSPECSAKLSYSNDVRKEHDCQASAGSYLKYLGQVLLRPCSDPSYGSPF